MADICAIDQYSDPRLLFKAIRGALDIVPGLNIKVRGWSMAPAIKDGDIVILEKTESARIKNGDIVFFRSRNSRFICHRVIDKKLVFGEWMFVAKGDACLFIDEEFAASRILGSIRKIIRGGRVIDLERHPFYRLIRFLNVGCCCPAIRIVRVFSQIRNSLAVFSG